VTFRLYDWNHVDAKTGQPRPLQVEQAMACIDFAQGAICPVVPVVEDAKLVLRERLLIVNISGCGGSMQNRHLQLVSMECRVFWYASLATVRWSTMAPIMPSAKAMYCSCRPWSERVCADARCH